MTIVAIWHEQSDAALWSVADTHISNAGRGGGRILRTDSGSKLFSLPIVCRNPSSDPGFKRQPYFSRTFGFAFAGDVLPALMTIATATTLLQELITVETKVPPSLTDIAEFTRKLAQRFSTESLSTSNGSYGRFEASVFGRCPLRDSFQISNLQPSDRGSDFCVVRTDHDLSKEPDHLTVLGSGKTKFVETMEQLRLHGDPHGRTGRLPKLVIEAMINDDDRPDIGGSLSIGITGYDFGLYSFMQPVVTGQPLAWRSFNGIGMDTEIGPVGHCIIGMHSMV